MLLPCASNSAAASEASAKHLPAPESVLISLAASIARSPAPTIWKACDFNLPDALCSAYVLAYSSDRHCCDNHCCSTSEGMLA